MTMKLPQKAGFVATTAEWDQLVRIAENLAAQVVQRDAALRQMQAERDAAREHAERQQLSKDGLYRELREMSSQRDAARAEVARLTAALSAMVDVYSEFDAYPTSDNHPIYAARAALRQPAPAGGEARP